MPFDFAEIFTAGVRELLPRLQARKLAFAFDCRGPQLTLHGDAAALRADLHRLLAGLIDLVEVGILVLDAETGCMASGRVAARVRLAGTGLGASETKVSAVLQRLGLEEVPPCAEDAPGTRRASGQGLRTGAPVEFVRVGAEGWVLRADWLDACTERWDFARAADARQAPAWLIDENAVGARTLARRLQRLGWAPRVFASAAQARAALLAPQGGPAPALVIATAAPALGPAELETLGRLLPPGTRRVLAEAGEPPAAAARAGRFRAVPHPLSPADLHRLTVQAPWRVTPPPARPHEEEVEAQEAAPELRPRLLVVDDNPLTRLFARSLAEGLGYEVASVPDGAAALRCCERWEPEVVLMDVHMAPWSGPQTTRRLRELQDEGLAAPCAVLAVTADDSEATRRACAEAGMDGHLVKPLLLPALAAELERVRARRARPPAAEAPRPAKGMAQRLLRALGRGPRAGTS